MTRTYDVAVIGLGLAGASALNDLARRQGVSVIGIDRFVPPHSLGSSHGSTRLVRVAYFENEAFTPMARHAITLWQALEARTGRTLFHATGVTCIGAPGSAFMASVREAVARHDVAFDDYQPMPGQFRFPADWECAIDREAGYLMAEASLQALLDEAVAHGADVRTHCETLAIEADGGRVRVRTSGGDISAGRAIVAAGAWSPDLVPALKPVTHIERQVLNWFQDDQGRFDYDAAGFRPFVAETADGGGQVKIAEHRMGTKISAVDALDRTPGPGDGREVEAFAAAHMPGIGARARQMVCMYPMARDDIFIIDRDPSRPNVIIGAGLSGHGFKFGPAIGEGLANLALDVPQASSFPSGLFQLQRFAAPAP